MKKVTGRRIHIEKVSNHDFNIDIQWDMDDLCMQATPAHLRDKFPSVDERQAAELQVILNEVIASKHAGHSAVCAWLEEIIAEYFSKGPISAHMALNRGPEAFQTPTGLLALPYVDP